MHRALYIYFGLISHWPQTVLCPGLHLVIEGNEEVAIVRSTFSFVLHCARLCEEVHLQVGVQHHLMHMCTYDVHT